jgi:NAD(P)-dependent dehydrogenase (short-subunit alcohol dehydrogenase family)
MLTTPAPSYSAAQQLQNEDILTLDSKQWEDTFQINMVRLPLLPFPFSRANCARRQQHHMFYTSKAAIPHLQKNKGAAIINNASINAFIGRPDLIDYTCAFSSL